MAKSNTRNGGLTYFNIDIERVSRTSTKETLRVRVRLTSPNVIDSNNDFRITGDWSFRDTVALNGIYSNDLVWTSPNLTVNRPGPTSDAVLTIKARLRWNGVEFWGGELDATDSYTVKRQDPVKPSAPGAPTFSSVTTSSLKASWSAPSSNGGAPIEEYQVRLSTTSGFSSSTPINTSSRSATFTGLDPNRTYYVKVRAKNSEGWGPYSSTRSVSTLMATPSAPRIAPGVSSITTSSMVVTSADILNWGGGTILEYQAQRATNTSFTSGVATISLGSSMSGTMSGLSRATRYYVRTRGRNAAGWGGWSATRTVDTPPDPPTLANGATHDTVTRNSFRVVGTPISDNGGQAPNNLRVQYNTSASTSGATIKTAGSWNAVSVTGLAPATQYYYRKSAANSAGWGPWTTWQAVTTLSAGPDDMEPPTLSSITETSALASWAIPDLGGAQFVYLTLQWSTSPAFETDTVSSTMYSPETSKTLTDLTPGTTYYVRIRMVTSGEFGGTGAWAESSFTTAGDPPSPGLRVFAFVDGEPREGELYTFVDGVLKKLTVSAVVGEEVVP